MERLANGWVIRTYKYSLKQSRISEQMMFVGIQANEGHPITEETIVEFFCKEGYSVDDDFIYQKENEVSKKFEYFNADEANYTIFKEVDDLDFFTDNVILFLNSHPNGTITVKDDEDEDEFLYIGNIKQFLKIWRNDLDGEWRIP